MTPEQAKQFCKALKIPVGESRRKGWVEVPCPLAPWRHSKGTDSNPSFGIRVGVQSVAQVHCFSCAYSGDLIDLVMELRHLSEKDSRYDFKLAMQIAETVEEEAGLELAFYDDKAKQGPPPVYYFPESWLDTFPSCLKAEDGLLYCQSRSVPKWVIKELDLRYDPLQRRVCFPVRDFAGDLVGFHGRAIDKDNPLTYRMYTYPQKGGHNNPQFWFGEHLLDLDKPVLAVESVFDHARAYEVYRNTACPLTAEINKDKVDRMRDVLCMITMLDGDKAGRRGAAKLRKGLEPHTHCININIPDDLDPGKMSTVSIRKLLDPALKALVSLG